MRKPVPER